MSEPRLSNKLYAFEVAYSVVFLKKVNENIYDKLVAELLELRYLSDDELAHKFQEDRHAFVNSAYEWDYYVSTLFESAGVLDKKDGVVICKLQHGITNTFRKVTRNEVSIPDTIKVLVDRLQIEYPFSEKPLLLNDPERLTIDVIKEIYQKVENKAIMEDK